MKGKTFFFIFILKQKLENQPNSLWTGLIFIPSFPWSKMLIPTPFLSCNNVTEIQIKGERGNTRKTHASNWSIIQRERERERERERVDCTPSEFYSHVNGDILLQLSWVRLGRILRHWRSRWYLCHSGCRQQLCKE